MANEGTRNRICRPKGGLQRQGNIMVGDIRNAPRLGDLLMHSIQELFSAIIAVVRCVRDLPATRQCVLAMNDELLAGSKCEALKSFL